MKRVFVLIAALAAALTVAPAAAQEVPVPAGVIKDRIAAALPADVRGADYELRLNNAGRVFLIPAEADLDAVTVSGLRYDQRSQSFNATLLLPSADGLRTESITGRIEEMIAVPVLTGSFRTGDLITARDIAWIDVPSRQVSRNTVTSAEDLVGMAARRPLRPDSLIRLSDIERPVLVERGALVTMLVESDRLVLTAVGQALEDGAEGDRIRVTNTSSNTTVQGVVVSPRKVRILTGSALAQLN